MSIALGEHPFLDETQSLGTKTKIWASTLTGEYCGLDNEKKVKIQSQEKITELSIRKEDKLSGWAWKQKLWLCGKRGAAKWKWDWAIVACVRSLSAVETQWRSEGGGGGRGTEAQSQRLGEFIGRSSNNSRVSGRLAYLAGDSGEHPRVWFTLQRVCQLAHFDPWPSRTIRPQIEVNTWQKFYTFS